MDASNEILVCFRYLSSLADPMECGKVCQHLESKLHVIPQQLSPVFGWYVDYCKNMGVFPSWDAFRSTYPQFAEPVYDEAVASSIYGRVLAIWECDHLADRIKSASFSDRLSLVSKMVSVLDGGQSLDSRMQSSRDLASVDSFKVTPEDASRRFRFPISALNRISVVRPGNTVAVLASPGSGKTQFCLNIAYQNSFMGDFNTLYIYLENLPRSYEADLLSRFSYDLGSPKVDNATLKRGVDEDDQASLKVLDQLTAEYRKRMRGEIYFKAFTDYPTDPLRFAGRLAQDIRDYNVDIICFDYLQRAKALTPLTQDSMAYLNQLMSCLSQVALGGFGAPHPTVVVVAVQPNREGQAKALKSNGESFNLTAIAEVNSVERDCFMVIALHRNGQDGLLSFKVVKNRDNMVQDKMDTCAVEPEFCMIGDAVSDEQMASSLRQMGSYSVDEFDRLNGDASPAKSDSADTVDGLLDAIDI